MPNKKMLRKRQNEIKGDNSMRSNVTGMATNRNGNPEAKTTSNKKRCHYSGKLAENGRNTMLFIVDDNLIKEYRHNDG